MTNMLHGRRQESPSIRTAIEVLEADIATKKALLARSKHLLSTEKRIGQTTNEILALLHYSAPEEPTRRRVRRRRRRRAKPKPPAVATAPKRRRGRPRKAKPEVPATIPVSVPT